MRTFLLIALAIVLVPLLALGGMLAFSSPKAPPLLPFMSDTDQNFGALVSQLPKVQRFPARDGTMLSYRLYEGRPGGGVAVSVHGSSGSALSVHVMSKALADAGFTVYAPDFRGHGGNGSSGDVAYVGQLEDDLEDLVKTIGTAHPQEKRVLYGHSQGGGFVLKVAASPRGSLFDAIIAGSPFMGANTPMTRAGSSQWADAAVPRVIALYILNGFGITAFNHLPVLAYAVPDDAKGERTRINTFAFLASASFDRDWQAALKRITKPTAITIGEKDGLFFAEAYGPNVKAANPAVAVEVMPGLDHMGSVLYEPAPSTTVRLARQLLGAK